MNILRVAQKVYPDVTGGGAYHVHALSRDQAALGHDVTVLTVRRDDSASRREQHDGYTVVRRDPTGNLLGNEISIGLARELWDAEDFDVIHAHSHLYFSTNVAALRRRFDDVPLAVTNHGLYSQSASRRVFEWYLQSVGRWTLDQADLVFSYTETDKERVRNLGVEARIEVVSNGVDTDRFKPDGSASDLIEADGPVVLFVGRLVDGKRPADAVKGLKRLREKRPNAELFLCGQGPLRDELADLSGTLGLDGAVHFLDHVAYDEMPAIYRSADVLILPSRAEGMPRTVLEAFASGLPVVSSYLEHTASTVRSAGETVELGDITGYGTALDSVLDRDDELGHRGRETALAEFQWEETVARTTDYLRSIE